MSTDQPSPDAAEPAPAPTIRVLSGHPGADELAALVVVLSALGDDGAAHGGGAAPSPSRWADPAWRLVGPSAAHGGWRSASLPR